ERFDALQVDLLEATTPERLQRAAIRALTPPVEPHVDLQHVAPIRASVADALSELADDLPDAGRISFRRLTASFADRIEVIVRFLAVLELYKQGFVDLEQTERFGEIEVEWTGGTDDRELVLASLDDEYEG